MTENAATEHLSKLHAALVDTREGYRKAVEKAETPDVRALLVAVDALHGDAHRDIHGILVGRGLQPDDDGSLMGAIHKSVIAARAAIVGLAAGSLSSFASGEEHNLKAYEQAIEAEHDEAVRNLLLGHHEALAHKVALLKAEGDRQ